MKTFRLLLILNCCLVGFAADQTPPPVYQGTAPAQPAAQPVATVVPSAVPATPAPPPASPAKLSAADLEKLVAPIALYPDPLIATILPASVYPLEIVQAARFVANTNNLANLDAQPWDENVKAVARVPAVVQRMNDDLPWTIALGEAFLTQDKDLMDTIQSLRGKAQKSGALQTTTQQVVTVTNMVVERTIEQQVVVVTNTVVQIQPSNPQVVYVPTYNPQTVYYPPPSYVYDPVAPLVTFGVGVAVGAIIANNCDWHGGGIYVGHHGAVVWGGGGGYGDVDVDIDIENNFNRDTTVNRGDRPAPNSGARAGTTGATATQQKWQPDQNRVRTSGSPTSAASAGGKEARGWSSGGARPSTQPATAARPTPSAGTSATRPSTGTAASARPSTGASAASRPSAGSSATRAAPSTGASRPTPSPSPSQPRSTPSASRPSPSGSAFGGVNSGARARSSSSRGASSRGFSGGGGRGGGRR